MKDTATKLRRWNLALQKACHNTRVALLLAVGALVALQAVAAAAQTGGRQDKAAEQEPPTVEETVTVVASTRTAAWDCCRFPRWTSARLR